MSILAEIQTHYSYVGLTGVGDIQARRILTMGSVASCKVRQRWCASRIEQFIQRRVWSIVVSVWFTNTHTHTKLESLSRIFPVSIDTED